VASDLVVVVIVVVAAAVPPTDSEEVADPAWLVRPLLLEDPSDPVEVPVAAAPPSPLQM